MHVAGSNVLAPVRLPRPPHPLTARARLTTVWRHLTVMPSCLPLPSAEACLVPICKVKHVCITLNLSMQCVVEHLEKTLKASKGSAFGSKAWASVQVGATPQAVSGWAAGHTTPCWVVGRPPMPRHVFHRCPRLPPTTCLPPAASGSTQKDPGCCQCR